MRDEYYLLHDCPLAGGEDLIERIKKIGLSSPQESDTVISISPNLAYFIDKHRRIVQCTKPEGIADWEYQLVSNDAIFTRAIWERGYTTRLSMMLNGQLYVACRDEDNEWDVLRYFVIGGKLNVSKDSSGLHDLELIREVFDIVAEES